MSELLSVTVNKREYDVPNTVETVGEFFTEIGWGVRQDDYKLFLVDGAEHIGPLGEMLVFDDGDEFVAIPRTLNGG